MLGPTSPFLKLTPVKHEICLSEPQGTEAALIYASENVSKVSFNSCAGDKAVQFMNEGFAKVYVKDLAAVQELPEGRKAPGAAVVFRRKEVKRFSATPRTGLF